MTVFDGTAVQVIDRPQLCGAKRQAVERAVISVLRALTLAATAQPDDLGFVLATHSRIASHCGLTVKQVRLALTKLESGEYIVKQRCSAGLGVAIPHFAEQRRRFGVIDDPAVVNATPEGKLPIVNRKPQQGERRGMGSLLN